VTLSWKDANWEADMSGWTHRQISSHIRISQIWIRYIHTRDWCKHGKYFHQLWQLNEDLKCSTDRSISAEGVPYRNCREECLWGKMSRELLGECDMSGGLSGQMSESPCRIKNLRVRRLWFVSPWLTHRQTDRQTDSTSSSSSQLN